MVTLKDSKFEARHRELSSIDRTTRRLRAVALAVAVAEVFVTVGFAVYRSETAVFPDETPMTRSSDE